MNSPLVYCNQCGHPNPEGSNFCARCGEPLVTVDDRPTGPMSEASEAVSDSTRIISSVGEEPETHELSDEEESAVRALPANSALLIVRRGPSAGARFLLDGDEVTAGRHPGSGIFLDDITVSRHHVRFTRPDQAWVARDLGSLNGTYINRRLIDADVAMQPGDEVQIGKFRLVFFVSAAGQN